MKNIFTKAFLFSMLFLGLQMLAFAASNSLSFSACLAEQPQAKDAMMAGGNTQGIKDGKQQQASLNAFPNPSRGMTTIVLSQVSGSNYKVRISNAIGKVVKTIAVENPYEGVEVHADLSEMPGGFYFYSLLVNDKMVETKRLILQQ